MNEMHMTYVSMEDDPSVHSAYEAAIADIDQVLGKSHSMYISGREVTPGRLFNVRSPIDRMIRIGSFQSGDEREADLAIHAAAEGADAWSETSWKERSGIIRATAERIDSEKFRLAALITMEVGKNRFEALAEVAEAVDMLKYYDRVYAEHEGFTLQMSPAAEREQSRSVMRPHGVFAVISPFNFPVALAAGMISAALLTGNTVVFKPASAAPLSGLSLYHLFRHTGIPEEALHVITGPGKPFGDVVTRHQLVDGIAFTGSRDAGMWLYRTFAANQPYPKPVVTEMGSKNPVIVTAGADLSKAVEGIVRSAFGYSGQKCSATSRVYVDTRVASGFLNLLSARTGLLQVGDPRVKDVFMGPVIDENAQRRFQAAVAQIMQDGGTIVSGGHVLEGGLYKNGYYIQPTVVTGLPGGHRLSREELFIPLVVVETVSSLEEAIVKANMTEYGLTAGIFSEYPGEIERFFAGIRFGVCYANRSGGATTGAWPGAQPFTGWKVSGSTGKGVGGPYYLLSYLREQAQTRVG